jgi:hypothetical protein
LHPSLSWSPLACVGQGSVAAAAAAAVAATDYNSKRALAAVSNKSR